MVGNMLKKFSRVLEEWRYTPSAKEREQLSLPEGCIRVFKTGQGELGSVYRAEFLRRCNEKYVPSVFTEEFSTFFTDKDEEDVLRNIIDKLVKASSMSNPVCLVADGFDRNWFSCFQDYSRIDKKQGEVFEFDEIPALLIDVNQFNEERAMGPAIKVRLLK